MNRNGRRKNHGRRDRRDRHGKRLHSRGARQARDMKSARNVANVMGNDMNSMDTTANATNDVARRRNISRTRGSGHRTACAADRIDAVGGVQRRHRARCAVAYRGICAAIAQVAGRQSFGDACNAGISCAGRRAGCARSAADIAEIVGNERFRKRSALHRKHGIVDLLAIGERAVRQRMFGDDL